MKKLILTLLVLCSHLGFSQKSLDELLNKYNSGNIPYISVEELNNEKHKLILLDAREEVEFKISHLKNAMQVGYKYFDINTVSQKITNKNTHIVVYCSLGIRSEDIAIKLKKTGYLNVKNLYGGIFEWKNKDYPIYNSKNNPTDSIHAYSKTWSKWLNKGTKVYNE